MCNSGQVMMGVLMVPFPSSCYALPMTCMSYMQEWGTQNDSYPTWSISGQVGFLNLITTVYEGNQPRSTLPKAFLSLFLSFSVLEIKSALVNWVDYLRRDVDLGVSHCCSFQSSFSHLSQHTPATPVSDRSGEEQLSCHGSAHFCQTSQKVALAACCSIPCCPEVLLVTHLLFNIFMEPCSEAVRRFGL